VTKFIAEWNAAKFKHKMLVKSAEGMARVCRFVAEKAQANAPVRTGKLREEITYKLEVQEDVVEGIVGVGKEAFYARFIEMGTSKMAARPFLRPAVFENTDEIMRLLVGKG
jgi:HK97 gp10 family phage protein